MLLPIDPVDPCQLAAFVGRDLLFMRSRSHSRRAEKINIKTHLNLKLNEIAFRLDLGIEETRTVEYLIEIEAILRCAVHEIRA